MKLTIDEMRPGQWYRRSQVQATPQEMMGCVAFGAIEMVRFDRRPWGFVRFYVRKLSTSFRRNSIMRIESKEETRARLHGGEA